MKQQINNNGLITTIEIKDESFKIGKYCDLKMIMTNKNNDKYEITVQLKKGWSQKDLKDIIIKSALNCESEIIEVNALFDKPVSFN